MMSMVEDGVLDPKLAPSLRVHLDWIQYKTNFRDPVIVRRTADAVGTPLPLAEIAVDLRQADADRLPERSGRRPCGACARPRTRTPSGTSTWTSSGRIATA